MFNRVLYVVVFVISLCFVGSVFAANKVYPLDYRYGIVADDAEWACKMSSEGNKALGVLERIGYNGVITHITGKAQYLPLSFDFFSHQVSWGDLHFPNSPRKPSSAAAFNDAKLFLSNYAQKNSTIFSSLDIESLAGDSCFIVRGSISTTSQAADLHFI